MNKRAHITGFLMLGICLLCCICEAGVSGEILVTRFDKGAPVIQAGTNDFYGAKRTIRDLQDNTPDVKPDSPKKWRKLYDVVSKELVRSAEGARLDAGSLEKLLKILPDAEENKGVAVIPVAAHQTQEKGERVWVITLKWEEERAVIKGGIMSHMRHFSFLQKSLKQTGFATCG